MQVTAFGKEEPLHDLTEDVIKLFMDLHEVANGEQILLVNITGSLMTELKYGQLTVVVK